MTTPMMQQYREAKTRHPGMILLFRMGDFYETFEDDAEVVSRVLGLTLTDAKQEMIDGAIRLSWDDRLEVYTIPALGHGTPIDSRDVGVSAPFILDVGISSSRRIAEFWGLLPQVAQKPVQTPAPQSAPKSAPVTPPEPALTEIEMTLGRPGTVQSVAENLIRRALRAAGLLKR